MGKGGLRSSHGNVLLTVLMYAVLGAILAGILITAVLRKTTRQVQFRMVDKKAALLKAIVSRAMSDLHYELNHSLECSLNGLLLPNSLIFNVNSPKVYGKGEFVLDEYGDKGLPTGIFSAPETDPQAWIDPPVANSANGLYKLHVKTSICTQWTKGRIKFTDEALGLGKNWNVSCPSSQIQDIAYEAYFDTSSFIADYAIYLDRSLLGNVAFDEPTSEDEDDTEERGKSGSYVEIVNGEPVHMTGATQEGKSGGSSCSGRMQSVIQNLLGSQGAALMARDACSRVALWVVAGSGSTPTNLIRSLWSDNKSNAVPDKYFRKMTQFAADVRDDLIRGCNQYAPSGAFSGMDVLQHYLKTHQPVKSTLPANEQGRRRVLLMVSDGWTELGNVAAPKDSVAHLHRADVFFTGNSCNGTGVVETSAGSGSPSADMNGLLVYAGESLYETAATYGTAPASAPAPASLDPMPNNALLVHSVRNSLDGSCIDILSSSNEYVADQYPYYVRRPWVVTPKTSEPTKVADLLANYKPIQDFRTQFTDLAKYGLQDYPNAMALYPMPLTDLDEMVISSSGMSQRPFDPEQAGQDMIPSYLGFFRWLDSTVIFKEGIKIWGLTDTKFVPPAGP